MESSGKPEDKQKYVHEVMETEAIFTVDCKNSEVGFNLPENMTLDDLALMYYGLTKLMYVHREYLIEYYRFSEEAINNIEFKAKKAIVGINTANKNIH
jgi:hypothetical protein